MHVASLQLPLPPPPVQGFAHEETAVVTSSFLGGRAQITPSAGRFPLLLGIAAFLLADLDLGLASYILGMGLNI